MLTSNWSGDSLRLASQIDASLGPAPESKELIAGHLLQLHEFQEQCFVREGGNWLDVSETSKYSPRWRTPVPASRLWNLASVVFHHYESASRAIDDVLATFQECR